MIDLLLCAALQTYPAPAPDPDEAKKGYGIQRTMSLLATSTPEKRNRVRILFYGQSITEQSWTKDVAADLRRRFPHADLDLQNRSIGGWASQLLIRSAEHDLYPFYPDLLIFYVYGDHTKYDEIIRQTRSRTTSEVLMLTDHMAVGDQSWSETMSTRFLPEIARKYGAELADIRTPWKAYLKDNGFDAQKLLSDTVHLNDHGNFLLAELVKRHLRHDPKLPAQEVVKEVAPALRLEFEGNRVDAVVDAPGRATLTIDGQAPDVYAYTRPNDVPGWVWVTGVVTRVDWEKPRVAEDWTLKISEYKGPKDFRFTVAGSKTGPDGEGSSAARFVSTSGRVVLDPKDFFFENCRKPIAPGFEIKWTCRPLFSDGDLKPGLVTLVQGLPNGKHVLELKGGAKIKLLRVYRPPVKP
ncbi:MAG TPA: SGNH/GDSL hydrolase family protein [Planctomycetota bacterium]